MAQEKFTTLYDLCDSQQDSFPMFGYAKMHLGDRGKIACVPESLAQEAGQISYLRQFKGSPESLAVNLAMSRVRTNCSQCFTANCKFRREENPGSPETKMDAYYQPDADLKKFL